MKKSKLALHWQILIGMVIGIVTSLLLVQYPWGKSFVIDWIKPFGNIFINSLKLIAVPLILASLIKGVSDLKDISKLSKMGFKTIGLYLITTIVAVSVGLIAVNVFNPGRLIEEKTKIELIEQLSRRCAI
jgi:proton glutamate symport protein